MVMPWGQVLKLLAKAGPLAAKQLPKLWPLLLETKNRKRVMEMARDLASQSPRRRLRARIDLTAALAEDIAAQAKTDEEREKAQDWSRRARNLARRLDMPVVGRQSKREHRHSIEEQLAALQAEMNDYLGD
ncbi:MAG TPA: hypothetical protein VFI91_12815 [Longimicrobiaceae bacterium]|nr:hypothetical protein [Longimicrobiaceae bacterium]